MEHHRSTPLDHRRTRIASVLIGIGLMAAVDEIVFHQLLAWHHLVDGYSGAVALASDGALHSAELLFLIAGLFMAKQLIETQRLARGEPMSDTDMKMSVPMSADMGSVSGQLSAHVGLHVG